MLNQNYLDVNHFNEIQLYQDILYEPPQTVSSKQ